MSTCQRDDFEFEGHGCQVPVGNTICGETKSLNIINEFKKLYEDKMHQIDTAAGGDCLQEKIRIQQEWIGDLTEQNEMLVRAVYELECEATERVQMLEEKLQQSAKSVSEVMKKYREYDVTNDLLKEPLQRIFNLENDQKNLLEYIRRGRDENRWSVDGLNFCEVSPKDLLKKDTDFTLRCSQQTYLEVRKTARAILKMRSKYPCYNRHLCGYFHGESDTIH